MATTLKQLEKRVSTVEKKLAKLMKESKAKTGTRRNGRNGKTIQPQTEREQKVGWAAIAKPGSWLAKQVAMQPEINQLAAKIFAEMGFVGEPADPRIIQEKMIERGSTRKIMNLPAS
jgi:hypothetical protein